MAHPKFESLIPPNETLFLSLARTERLVSRLGLHTVSDLSL